MTSMVQHPQQGTSSLAKLTKGGFGFSSHRGHEKKEVVGGDDDDWYIPYNGPYEAPRAPSPRQQRLRDSWGDPLDDYASIVASNADITDDEDILRRLADLDARNGISMGHRRGGTHGSTGSALSETTFTRYVHDEQDRTIRGRSMQRGRAGSGSVFSNQTTTTSGAQDPSRTQRQSTISAATATGLPKPSHLSLSAVGGGFALGGGGGGGVGESPVPTRRFGGGDGNRISFASIFSGFSGIGGLANSSGKSHKRGDSNSSIGKLRWGSGSPARSNTAPPDSPYAKKMMTTTAAAAAAPQDSPRRIGTPTAWPSGSGSSRPTASPETDRFVRRETETINSRTVNDAVQERIDSLATDDEDYYNSYYSTLIQGSPTVKGKAPMSRTHIVKKQTSLPLPQTTTRPGQMLHRRTPSNSGESTTSNSRMHLHPHPHPRGYPNPNLNQVQPQQQQQQPGDRLAFPSLSHPNPHSNPHPHAHPHSHSHSHSPSLSRQNSASNTSRSTPSRQNSTSSNSYGNPTNSNSRPHPYAAAYVFPSSSVIPPATTSYVQQTYVPRVTTTGGMMNSYNYNANAPNGTLSSPTGPVHPNSADAAHLAFSPRDPRTKASEQQRNAGGLGFGMGLLRSLKNSISTPDLRASLVGNPAGGSTTNLHNGAPQTATTATAAEKGKGSSQKQPQPTFVFPKGKERWLSAQTWCDAVLFPRPRLKIKQDLLANANGSEALSPTTLMASRNMSPPGTPMTPASAFDDDDDEEEVGAGKPKARPRLTSVRESAIASRVLAYSRSLVDLNSKQGGKERAGAKESGAGKGKGVGSGVQTRPRAQTQVQSPPIVAGTQGARPRYPSHGVPPAQLRNKERQIPQVTVRPPEAEAGPSSSAAEGQGARPPRPKSWAWDDLALPSPAPSLARVLQEGEQLEAQRQEWQRQAKASFGNKHSRSLSRNRTQSASRARLRHPVQAGHHHHQSSLEYLAAQACLGTQNLTPPIAPRAFHFNGTSSHDSSSNGHSHSSSLVKTISKSSQTHSRNASWSKGALKLAKSTVACGLPLGHGSLSPSSASSSVGHAHPPGDLEGALRTQNTRVIRLADPAQAAQLPVEERPTSLVVRHTPSPAFSALSDSKVGIAIGTPPAEASFDFSLPSHPYAAGGFSISNHAGGNGAPVDYAGPHPITNTAKPPGITGQRLPPQIAVHPYAQAFSNRDSYIDANGLIGQYRSDANTPHPSKMWAQISPGVVREILPGDIEYSPFMSEDGDRGSPVVSNRNTLMINDTVGVGETLVNAVARLRESKDSGLGTSEGHNGGMPKPNVVNSRAPQTHDAERDVLTSFPSMGWRAPNQGPIINLYAPDNSSDSLDDAPYPRRELLVAASRDQSNSPAITSESSSPHTSPQPLGSPHDLDGFQDLFYRPTSSVVPPERNSTEAALPDTPHAWDSINVRHHSRTGSGLTSLARQLTDEFEQIAQEFRDSSVQYTPRSGPVSSTGTTMGSSRGPSIGRRPTNGSFPFVFEEPAEDASVPHPHPTRDGPLQAFKASDTLPEDVLSSRASSFMEPESDDENTGRYRVGMVESVSTPPITSSERRLSFNVQTSLVQGDTGEPTLLSPLHPPLRSPTDSRNSRTRRQIISSLQAPTSTTGAKRSSYMTTASDLSRMSGLSDFPVPPKDQNTLSSNISLLSTYFNNDTAMMSNDPNPSGPPGSSAASLMQEERVTFGRYQNADDLAKTLSSPPRFDPPVPF